MGVQILDFSLNLSRLRYVITVSISAKVYSAAAQCWPSYSGRAFTQSAECSWFDRGPRSGQFKDWTIDVCFFPG